MTSVDVNGKFLSAGLNGVHRTAGLYTQQLIRRLGNHHVRLLAPVAPNLALDLPELTPQVHKGHFGTGQGWEWFTLPALSRANLLVNFCNLAPLLHPNSVVMIHDAQTFLYPDDYTGKQATAYRRLLPWIGRRARRILTVSHFARESLAAHGVGSLDKIDVIHNGTDHLLSTPEDNSILEQHGLQPGRYVLTVGSTKHYKNMQTLFKAMHEPLPDGQVLVIAGGPGAQHYRARGWLPPASAIFTGFVSDAQLRALYAAAGVFVFPSLTEGFGLPPVEAMHCGTPVVAAKAGAMPEVCNHAAILVDAQDANAYRCAIQTILSDRELAESLRHRGALRAGQLTWNAAGERLHSLLSPLL